VKKREERKAERGEKKKENKKASRERCILPLDAFS
jgi:hypothetical protein